MNYTKKLWYHSNYWYNDGLKKANMRDMSGAIISLKKSLKFNRENVVARNLLGLVYYGQGEVIEALVQWIISKNIKSYENIANYYIKKVQESPSELDTINQAIHKYNQCLIYCRQNGEDLAIIQLKKVIMAHPTFLKAYQLLALLYLHTGQYAKARQILKRAHKLDITNTITLSYMHELTRIRNKKIAKIKEEKEDTVTYKLGNETIIQPSSSGLKDNATVLTFLNIVVGIAVGAAVIWFLIMPAVNQKKAAENNKSVIQLSEQVASQDTQIEALKEELEAFRMTDGEAQNAIDAASTVQTSYESVISLYQMYEGEQTSNADMLEVALVINPEVLGDYARALYDEVTGFLFPKMVDQVYSSAVSSLESADYPTAVASFENVALMDAGYDSGYAMKYLGDAYAGNEQTDEAAEQYKLTVSSYPDTQAAIDAQAALDAM